MSSGLDVFATVVDITKDMPKADDKFLIDTNVWYWLAYSRVNLPPQKPQTYQLTTYPNYVQKALKIKSLLYNCGLSFSELSHQIEQKERRIFALTQGIDIKKIDDDMPTKKFRHDYSTTERPRVLQEIKDSWEQIEQFGKSLNLIVDDASVKNVLQKLVGNPQENRLDGYDLFFLEVMFSHNVTNIITDDKDFLTVKGIKVFTANHNAISAARKAGKLQKR